MMPATRSKLLRLLPTMTLCLLALPIVPALAQTDFPNRPVKLIVPFPAGGSADIVARVLAEGLRKTLGQPVIVENRGGAGGMMGTDAIAQAIPDGYTIGMATVSTMTVNPVLYPKAQATNAKLRPLVKLVSMPSVFVVHPSMGVKNFDGFVAAIKEKPGYFNAGVPGVASMGQFIIESFNETLDVKITNVPYRGNAPALNDALAGVVQIMTDQLPSALPNIKAGRLLPIAIASDQRVADLPNTPTFKELGYSDLNEIGISWFGLVVPEKTPPAIAEKQRAAALQAVRLPETLAQLRKMGVSSVDGETQDFPALVAAQLQRNRVIAQKAGIKPEGDR